MLKAGTLTVLRTEDAQGNQLLRCDPAVSQGQEFTVFQFGCEPWYGVNTSRRPELVGRGHSGMPRPEPVVRDRTRCPLRYRPQLVAPTAWRCVPLAPGISNGQIGDWMPSRPKNCDNIENNSCQDIVCN